MASTAYVSTRDHSLAPYSAQNIPSATGFLPLLVSFLFQPVSSVLPATMRLREQSELTNRTRAYAVASHSDITGCNVEISSFPSEEMVLQNFASRLLENSVETPREVSRVINANLFNLL